jgi:hypothetical protein
VAKVDRIEIPDALGGGQEVPVERGGAEEMFEIRGRRLPLPERLGAHERVVSLLVSDGGERPVTRMDHGPFRVRKDAVADGADEGFPVPSRQIGAPDGALEEDVPRDEPLGSDERHAPR